MTTVEKRPRGATPPSHDPGEGGSRDPWAAVLSPLAGVARAPLTSYHVVIVVTCLLCFIGLGMVLASSNVLAFAQGGTPFDTFLRQALFVVIGWVGFAVALRVRMRTLRRLALPALLVAIALLVAVLLPGIGSEINGSRGWINLGLFSIQPAEIAKLCFIVWAAGVMAPRMRTGRWQDLLWPSALGFVVVAGLIVIAPDLGMATSTAVAFLCMLWFAGYPARHFLWVLGIGLAGFAVMAMTMAYRFARVQTFVNTFRGDFSNPQGDAYQSYQGMLSLADGGLFGVGLGQSSAKWFYLPEATNDFIFAIIGEELGWTGAAVVVGLYMALSWAGLRIAMRSVDPARRLLAGTVTCSIVLQAFINIGYVVGLLPVTGLQLPLISSGGTSAALTLTSLGLLANCARHEPEAISAILSSPRTRRVRWYSLPDPQPYTPERLLPAGVVPGRSSEQGHRYGQPVRREAARPAPPERGRRAPAPAPASRTARSPRADQPSGRPVYESVPVPREAGQRRGAAPVTGRTARTVRGREDRFRESVARDHAARDHAARERTARDLARGDRPRTDDPRDARRSAPEQGSRPSPLYRGRCR